MKPFPSVNALSRRIAVGLALLALALSPVLVADQAQAKKSKSVATGAKWIAFDAETNTVKVKITAKGRGNTKLVKKYKKTIKKGKEVTFNVIPTGSILKRTSVAINGMKGEMTDITAGKQIVIYWVEDPNKDGELFARKIDVVLSEEEWEERAKAVE